MKEIANFNANANFSDTHSMADAAMEWLGRYQIAFEHMGPIEIGLREAINNVVEHSYGETSEGDVHLRLEFEYSRLVICISDRGYSAKIQDFDNAEWPAPESLPEGGWGLALIKHCFDNIEYRTMSGANHLTLEKFLPSQLAVGD